MRPACRRRAHSGPTIIDPGDGCNGPSPGLAERVYEHRHPPPGVRGRRRAAAPARARLRRRRLELHRPAAAPAGQAPDRPGSAGARRLVAAACDDLAPRLRRRLAPLLDEPVDVLGHSLGGVVALRLAERHPALVRRIVLAAAAGISTSTRRAELDDRLPGPRPAGADRRPARSPASPPRAGCGRVVFGPFEGRTRICSPSARVHGFLRGPPCTRTRSAPALALAADDPRRDLERVRVPGARASGAPATARCPSRTASSTRAACTRRCG